MIAAILLFLVLASFFGLTYYLNSKTPLPKGCENLKEDCKGCKIEGCLSRKGE